LGWPFRRNHGRSIEFIANRDPSQCSQEAVSIVVDIGAFGNSLYHTGVGYQEAGFGVAGQGKSDDRLLAPFLRSMRTMQNPGILSVK
jgi:hypothetical protein